MGLLGLGGNIVIGIMAIGIVIAAYGIATQPSAEDIEKEQILMCTEDCESLGQEYFRFDYEYGRFGPDTNDCFCSNEGSVEQIW